MTAEYASTVAPETAETVESSLAEFLAEKTNTLVEPGQDLFASGLVSSMFAMQLVVHLEEAYDIAIVGPELKLENFRSVQAMACLVIRLRAGSDKASDS
jgi:methoxymalonate biosynthesis acyl carrier protein